MEVISDRVNQPRISVISVVTQDQPRSNTRIRPQNGSVRDDIVTDLHITEAWTVAPAHIYGGRVNQVKDVIGDAGIRDSHTVPDEDRSVLLLVLIGEGDRVVENIHLLAGIRVRMNRPSSLTVVDHLVTDRNIVASAVVNAMIVVLIELVARLAPLLAGNQAANVVDKVAFHQNIVLLDIDAVLPLAGIGADVTVIVDMVADDFRESAAAERIDAARAATGGVGHAINLEVLDANVIGATEAETVSGDSILSVDTSAPRVARFEGDQLARRAAAGEADNRFAALVGTAISIDAILDNHGITRIDDVCRPLNIAERLSLCAGVGVRAGGRHVERGAGGWRRIDLCCDRIGARRSPASLPCGDDGAPADQSQNITPVAAEKSFHEHASTFHELSSTQRRRASLHRYCCNEGGGN